LKDKAVKKESKKPVKKTEKVEEDEFDEMTKKVNSYTDEFDTVKK